MILVKVVGHCYRNLVLLQSIDRIYVRNLGHYQIDYKIQLCLVSSVNYYYIKLL